MVNIDAVSQRLNSYFTGSQELRQFSRTARELAALQRHYRRLAPPSLARASRVHWFEQQTLVLAADNAAIAAKLRQLAPQLVLQLRQGGVEVTGIQVKVQVGQSPDNRPAGGRKLSPAGRQQMAELAASLPDSPLKNALQRLAALKD
ncbi:MAG: DUF721 domain-containing protein [Sideroxydans sp.]|nr:DUF721 domain-containing protein [Sideroxydans sp.]